MSDNILTSVFVKLRNRFLRQARGMLPSVEEAEDVLQDTFVRLWCRNGQINSEKEAVALATTTIRNLAVDHYRNDIRHRTEHIDDNQTIVGEDPETESNRLDIHRLLEDIMAKTLTPLQRQIFEMKEYQGMTYEKIAETLNMQPPAVRMNMSRARKSLRDAYHKIKENEVYKK